MRLEPIRIILGSATQRQQFALSQDRRRTPLRPCFLKGISPPAQRRFYLAADKAAALLSSDAREGKPTVRVRMGPRWATRSGSKGLIHEPYARQRQLLLRCSSPSAEERQPVAKKQSFPGLRWPAGSVSKLEPPQFPVPVVRSARVRWLSRTSSALCAESSAISSRFARPRTDCLPCGARPEGKGAVRRE